MAPSAPSTCVLVADDDVVSRMTLTGVLHHLPGVEVVQAANGLEAWQLLEDGLRPLACCTDLVMPDVDGLALMDRIRAHPLHGDLAVVMITGTADRDSVLEAMQRGAAGYIVKPFAAAETVATLRRVMRSAMQRRAEAPAATRARLQQDLPTLAVHLGTLRQQARALARVQARSSPASRAGQAATAVAAEAAAAEADADLRIQLTGLRSACLTLGLWRPADLLAASLAGSPGRPALWQILREVEGCAADQLARLRLPLFD